MSDESSAATRHGDGVLILFGGLALLSFVGYYLLTPDKNWGFQTETVVVEKTVHHAPWYVDAAGPAMVLIIIGVILYGLQGGLPRP